MSKHTLQSRLVEALVMTGLGKPVEGRSQRYTVLQRLDKPGFWYVGRSGALRCGPTVAASVAKGDSFKRDLLARAKVVQIGRAHV